MKHSKNPSHCIFPSGIDWKPLLERYCKGEKALFSQLCYRSKPLAEQISHTPYFAKTLGQEEAYCIAAMSMVNYWHRITPAEASETSPGRLYNIMKCDLLNEIRWQKTRRRREVHKETDSETGTDATNISQEPVADRRDEPEQRLLDEDRKNRVRACLQYLSKKEKQVIDCFFFRQLTIEEIAAEMHCTTACVSSTKYNALHKLRSMFAEQELR